MLANITEETCTGTGLTLALAGVTDGNVPFAKKYSNGDPVPYFLEDSAGIIRVGGTGTYVSATDDITRNDSWNWNGTVIDDNPSSNITLGGGNHTVRCDVLADSLAPGIGISREGIRYSAHHSGTGSVGTVTLTLDRLYYIPFLNDSGQAMKPVTLSLEVTTPGTGAARMRLGYARAFDGEPLDLEFQTAEIDVSTTGNKSASVTGIIPVGWGFMVIIVNETITIGAASRPDSGTNPILAASFSGSALHTRQQSRVNQSFGSIPTSLPASTGADDLVDLVSIGVNE